MAERQTLTIPEAAEVLGIGRGLAYEAARTGELPGVIRVGRRLLVSRARLMELLGEPSDGNGPAPTEPLAQPDIPGRGEA
jgi:excisionase family DNA binding protein